MLFGCLDQSLQWQHTSIHQWSLNFPHKGPVIQKALSYHDNIIKINLWVMTVCHHGKNIGPLLTCMVGFNNSVRLIVMGNKKLPRCYKISSLRLSKRQHENNQISLDFHLFLACYGMRGIWVWWTVCPSGNSILKILQGSAWRHGNLCWTPTSLSDFIAFMLNHCY